jgi:hypothetical protein
MTPAETPVENFLQLIDRAEHAAVRFDGATLAQATRDLLDSSRHLRGSAQSLRHARAAMERFAETCSFLSRTLAECLSQAAVATPSTGARYWRHGTLKQATGPARVVARYG